ncbi:hypothetical protein G1C96_1139 [Bifidobacterium sp. DSM 109958]|uniref:Poly(Hydroxyalcanoate) granule associated protein (Phasin) n=1 Tax=Bifidobacterium moraviense TaxID=2675323 RepID=A0A7Y0F1Y8_9BIFI|nr:phasin family protein [Bifidobacterium sp. DSM 109958]NMN00560.1 hypothetical protein [Bifidobacterium sp. DSM 109958]
MAGFDLGEGLRKVFLAGVGALATTYEKGSEIVDDLVKKGELTVEQGKTLNEELRRTVREATSKPASEPTVDATAADEPGKDDAAEAEPKA